MSDDDDLEMLGAGDHDDVQSKAKPTWSGKRSEALNNILEDRAIGEDFAEDSDAPKGGKKRGKKSEAGAKGKQQPANKKNKRGQVEKPKAFCVKRITNSCCIS